MANLGPCMLALMLNFYGFQIFLKPCAYPKPHSFYSRMLFELSLYFLIIQFDLYSRKFRRIPWFFYRIYELFLCILILEVGCYMIWFPLETFLFQTFAVGVTSSLILSYLLSISCLFLVLHATYTINFSILTEYGCKELICDIYESLKCGIEFLTSCEDDDDDIQNETEKNHKVSKQNKKQKHKYNLRKRSSIIS